MITIRELNDFISNPALTDSIAQVWALLAPFSAAALTRCPTRRTCDWRLMAVS